MARAIVSMSNRFRNTPNPDLLHVATLGRTIGLKGDMNFNLHTDFPEQFVKGSTFELDSGITITIQSYNTDRDLVHIVGYDSPEAAKALTNSKLFTTQELTRERCKLGKNEYFWFDFPGLSVVDGETLLGSVIEIERIGSQDYLSVKTHDSLVQKGLPETFLIPYVDHYVTSVEMEAKKVVVSGGLDLLEAS
jgi:16S rRNA processing protein RimM